MKDPLLDFVAVGPQRTGTSWLHAVLRTHPQVQLPEQVKETFFFDQRYDEGAEWYVQHFAARRAGVRRGEIAPTLFDHPSAVARLEEQCPGVRVVVTLRDPLERALSLYRHHYNKGRVGRDLREAARTQPSIVEAGHYSVHLPRWIRTFGSEGILVLISEEVEGQPQDALDAICEFVGCQGMRVPPVRPEHVGSARQAPDHPRLAKWSAAAATLLRRKGMHRLVEAGKMAGLKRWAMRSSGAGGTLEFRPEEREWLAREYAGDLRYVRDLLQRTPPWLGAADD